MLADQEIINIIPKTKIFLNYFLSILFIILFLQLIGVIIIIFKNN